jgi:hypothetical protein
MKSWDTSRGNSPPPRRAGPKPSEHSVRRSGISGNLEHLVNPLISALPPKPLKTNAKKSGRFCRLFRPSRYAESIREPFEDLPSAWSPTPGNPSLEGMDKRTWQKTKTADRIARKSLPETTLRDNFIVETTLQPHVAVNPLKVETLSTEYGWGGNLQPIGCRMSFERKRPEEPRTEN